MSKILKRPMFRKGGPTNEGVVSLAQPRRNYSLGSPEQLIKQYPAYESVIKDASAREALTSAFAGQDRTKSDRLGDLLISGGLNLMSARPRGNIFATAAESFKEPTAQLLKEKQAEDRFKRQIKLQAVTGALQSQNAPEKDQIFRYAKERARILQIPENLRSDVDKNNLIFLDNELKKSQQYLREASPKAKIEGLARQIEKEEGRNLKVASGNNMAATRLKMEEGEIKDPRTNKPLTNYASRSLRPNEIVPQGDGSIAIANPDKTVQQTLKTTLSPNTIYITQQEGYLYLYEGNNKFRRIYP
jgi:hypothetical protein